MKYFKLYETFSNHLLKGEYLYHYTLAYNMDEIMNDGLIPNRNENYKDGAKAVFLTNKESLYSMNLPRHLVDEMDMFYEEMGDNDYENSDKPIVRLKIKVSDLEKSKFYPDDDYMQNKFNYNKANGDDLDEQVEDSLRIWGSVAYKGIIPPKNIVGYDYDYDA